MKFKNVVLWLCVLLVAYVNVVSVTKTYASTVGAVETVEDSVAVVNADMLDEVVINNSDWGEVTYREYLQYDLTLKAMLVFVLSMLLGAKLASCFVEKLK